MYRKRRFFSTRGFFFIDDIKSILINVKASPRYRSINIRDIQEQLAQIDILVTGHSNRLVYLSANEESFVN
jgi:hypothetical protein